MIQAKLLALQQYTHKDRPEWNKLLELLVLDTKDVAVELQQLAWEGLSGAWCLCFAVFGLGQSPSAVNPEIYVCAEAAKISSAFPARIFAHATEVVTTGDGQERAFAAHVLCSIAAHKHSWPVSQRSGHAVAAVDDALLSLAVGMQDMDPQVCL